MNRTTRKIAAALALPVMTLATFSGCGESGAKVKPTIIARPADKAAGGGGGGGESTAATTPAEAGTSGAGKPAAGGFGSFTGRVVFKGEPPAEPLIIKKGDASAKDAAVCAAMDLPDESLVVSKDGGVANVFIYLPKAPVGAKKAEASAEPVIFDQKNCRFIPHTLGVLTGTTVKVLNDDAVLHNTHNYPADGDNPTINSGIKPNDRNGLDLVYQASEKEPLAVKCDIHPFMIAYHLPLNHQYFAVTDKDGHFEIKDLPSGEHEFAVWHEKKKGFLTRKLKVSIKDGEPTKLDLPYGAADFARVEGAETKVVVLKHSQLVPQR